MNDQNKFVKNPCACCSVPACHRCQSAGLNRRDFLFKAGTLAAGGLMYSTLGLTAASQLKEPARRPLVNVPLRIQPVLTCTLHQKRQAGSWRDWGGLMTDQDIADEQARIGRELKAMAAQADFPMEILPLATVKNAEQAANVAQGKFDGVLMYAAGCGANVIEALAKPDKWNLMFVRHRSGPAYLWYEIAHPRFLRKTVDEFGPTGMDVQDVVVDSHADVLWRLRAMHGLKNTLGKRIVTVGGASGWGAGGRKAPEIARTLWKMEIVDVPYPQLGERIKQARQNAALVDRCKESARLYLRQHGISLKTDPEFVSKAFVLAEVFKDLMDGAETDAITINSCMGTIMPMAETTACLPLSLLNDAGYLAFCESDFVVIPSGILLHYISGKPVFLNDPTYPHHDVVTLAHCTAPRKMDGKHYEHAKILTHFESDYGAAPKVEMRLGQQVTTIAPDFASKKWVGFDGKIVANPFMAICRSQIDVEVKGGSDRLMEEMRGFHWMTSYGDYLRETGFALKKVGVEWLNVSPRKTA